MLTWLLVCQSRVVRSSPTGRRPIGAFISHSHCLPRIQQQEHQHKGELAPNGTFRSLSTSGDNGDDALFANGHSMNCAKALKKDQERKTFTDLVSQDISILQGIGPMHIEQLNALKINTIQDLANYKFYKLSQSIVTLADTEEENGRLKGTIMNLNKGLDKDFEESTLTNLCEQPVHVLQGLTPAAAEKWSKLGVDTVMDLSNYKYCKWAEALATAAKFEELP